MITQFKRLAKEMATYALISASLTIIYIGIRQVVPNHSIEAFIVALSTLVYLLTTGRKK